VVDFRVSFPHTVGLTSSTRYLYLGSRVGGAYVGILSGGYQDPTMAVNRL